MATSATVAASEAARAAPAANAADRLNSAPAVGADPATDRRRLRFTLTLRNPSAEPVTDQTIWVYMPLRETALQRLESLQVSMPHALSHDALGHSLLRLSLPRVGPLGAKVVTVQAEVSLRPEPVAQPLADPAAWLQAERFIESTDPAVRELAAALRRETPAQTLDAIYDWVRTNLQYAGYLADPLGAREALARRSGDCTEYAFLCTALARACGIAARPVGGYVVGASAAPRADEYHDWAEVHLGGAWRVMDAQKGCWERPAADYVGFRLYRETPSNALGTAPRFKVDGSLELRM
ncbi:transglutaminase family protein [Roseateles sp. YR242]|uniref:transglutaminase-like domain-containing protein n=1 Tax=Roseateles sp. YR242 TaxID=1855305 RepID=UPI0015A60BCB|nr:transglutaminase domain-containing protein [Roseateles sp. YR242]